MDANGECEHCDWTTPTTCSICIEENLRKLGKVASKSTTVMERPKASRPFEAQYDGECDGCSFPIDIGQVIVRQGDHYFHLGHES